MLVSPAHALCHMSTHIIMERRESFYQDAAKGEEKAPAPPKAEAKGKALKAMLKIIYSHIKKIRMSPTFYHPKTLRLLRQPKYPQRNKAQEKQV